MEAIIINEFLNKDRKFSDFRRATDRLAINSIVGWTGTDNVSIQTRDLLRDYVTRDEIEAILTLESIDFYDDGFKIKYPRNTIAYHWQLDNQGRIIRLIEITTGDIISINYNTGGI